MTWPPIEELSLFTCLLSLGKVCLQKQFLETTEEGMRNDNGNGRLHCALRFGIGFEGRE